MNGMEGKRTIISVPVPETPYQIVIKTEKEQHNFNYQRLHKVF
jgi:hypothetical protein